VIVCVLGTVEVRDGDVEILVGGRQARRLRQISIMDSMGLVVRNVRARVGGAPRRMTVRVSARPSRSEAAAPGWDLARSRARLSSAA
jgi:hypothetical protein